MPRTDPVTRHSASIETPPANVPAVFEQLEPRLLLSQTPLPAYEVWGGFLDAELQQSEGVGVLLQAATSNQVAFTTELGEHQSLVEGTVTDWHTSAPVADIEVQVLQGPDPSEAGLNDWDYVTSVRTDDQGHYEIFDLPDRTYRLYIPPGQSDEGYHYVEGNVNNVQVVAGTITGGVDMQLRHAGYIYGHVYDAFENPLGNVGVLVEAGYTHQEDQLDWHQAWTDEQGRYEVFVAETDREIYPVKISWPVADGVAYGVQIAPGLYAAEASGTAGPDFYLAEGGWLHGAALTEDQQPVANFPSVLEPDTVIPGGFFEDPNARTDENGEYRLPVPAGMDIYLITGGWGWDRFELGGQRYAMGERWVGPFNVEPGQTLALPTIHVPEAVTITGTVTDLLGNPLAGASVGAFGTDIFGGEIWLDAEDGAVTDELGNYVLDWVPAGRFELAARAEGYLDYITDLGFDMAPGETIVYDFALTPADQGARISGAISNFEQVTSQDALGTPLPYEIIDYGEYLRVEELGLVACGPDAPWTMDELLFPEKKWTGNADVEDGFDDYFGTNQGAGTFQIRVPSGNQALFAYRSSPTDVGGWCANLSAQTEFSSLQPGDELTGESLQIAFGTNSITGTVGFPTGHPGNVSWSSVTIFLTDSPDISQFSALALAKSGPSGEFVMPDLPDGQYYIYAVADGLAPFVSGPIELAGEQNVNVDINFQYPADLAFAEPEVTEIQTEIGGAWPVPFELINLGQADPGDVTVQLYASRDQIAGGDVLLELSPGGQPYSQDLYFISPGAPGTWYVYAVADPMNEVYESDEANNTSQFVSLVLTDPNQVEQFALADYFPLVGGMTRTYQMQVTEGDKTDTSIVTTTVRGEMVEFAGSEAVEMRRSRDGHHTSSTFYSMGEGGLMLHGQSQRTPTGWRETRFAPTLLQMCPADLSVGMSVVSAAPWEGTGLNGVQWAGAYQQQLDVIGFEQVIVPAGAYNALKIRFQIAATQTSDKPDRAINDDYYAWLVEGIGVVKEQGLWSETAGNEQRVWLFDYELLTRPTMLGGAGQVDLIARYDPRFAVPQMVVPGQKLRVPVIVQNLGTDPAVGQVALAAYASSDPFWDQADALLSRKDNVRLKLAPGAWTVVSLSVTVGDVAGPGNYFLLTCVDVDDVIPEAWEDNNTAISGYASQYVYQFGNVGGRRKVRLTLRDQFGTAITFSLRGTGYGEVQRNRDGSLDVTLHQTGPRSSAIFSTPRRTNGVVRNIDVIADKGEAGPVGGSLKALLARTIDLTGSVHVEGYLGQLLMDDVVDHPTEFGPPGGEVYFDGLVNSAASLTVDGPSTDHVIVIGPSDRPKAAVSLTFGSIGEMSIYCEMPIAKLIASEWVDNNETRDEIITPRLDRLLIRGDRTRDILGHFGADLLLGQMKGFEVADEVPVPSPARRPTLGSAIVRGDLYEAEWDIFGRMGSLTVLGRIETATVRTTERMGRIAFGGVLDSNFLAGISREVQDRATQPEHVDNPGARIQGITMLSRPLPGTGEGPFFQNSNFSAASIGPVRLLNVNYYNAGRQFGFYAGTISSISHRDTHTGEQWTWRKQNDGILSILDFFADAFATAGPAGA